MRGITYALAEIIVFMMAATLVGYLLGRLSVPRYWVAPADETVTGVETLLAEAEAHNADLAEALALAQDRFAELAATVEELSPTGLAAAEAGDPVAEAEIAALLDEVARQREMIERLDRVVSDADRMAGDLRERDARIADLEAAIVGTGGALPPALAYSSASLGSGAFTDAAIDFDLLD